ncbi:MAG: dephospho-CoA kinase [Desulforhopalus sp.]
MNIGITGGYGSGKSSVSRLLAKYLQAERTDADVICRTLLEPGQVGTRQLQTVFGIRFFCDDGSIDRNLLRQETFNIPEVKEKLENILHPLVRSSIADQAEACRVQNSYIVVEVPLLFEVGWQDDFDVTVLVRVPPEIAISRSVKRDNIDEEEAKRIIGLQLPMSYKESRVDYIIDNSDTFVSTAQQTAWLSNILCKKTSLSR